MRQFSLVAQLPPISLLSPAADAGGRTSSYRSLKGVQKAYIIAHINQGNAATVALTPLQASDVSGTGSKVIAATPIWADQDTATLDALVAQVAAANFTTSAAVKDKIVIFEILPEQALDVANGFYTVALQTGASNAANITEAILVIAPAYEQATVPTVTVN